jgi:erythromycin esterase-like protein
LPSHDIPDPVAVRHGALPLRTPADLDPVLDRVGAARVVLVGEASHGTHDDYWWRAELTKRLIEEHGFGFVAVEGDWPDCPDRYDAFLYVDRTAALQPLHLEPPGPAEAQTFPTGV